MKCNKCIKPDMAQIPYIAHEYVMFKAYRRENRLKMLLTFSTVINAILLCVILLKCAG